MRYTVWTFGITAAQEKQDTEKKKKLNSYTQYVTLEQCAYVENQIRHIFQQSDHPYYNKNNRKSTEGMAE